MLSVQSVRRAQRIRFSFFDVLCRLQGGADIGFELLGISGCDPNELEACWKDVPLDGYVVLCSCYLAANRDLAERDMNLQVCLSSPELPFREIVIPSRFGRELFCAAHTYQTGMRLACQAATIRSTLSAPAYD